MLGPIHVAPHLVFGLSPHEFTHLCSDLIRAEAGRLGVPQAHIDTTIREIAPDGGLDACIRDVAYPLGWTVSRWIPAGGSGWQFKSGRCPSAHQLATKEITKPEVLVAIDRGDTYCFLTADSLGKSKKTNIAKAIRLPQRIGEIFYASPSGLTVGAAVSLAARGSPPH
jgi:hypothetical protein